VSTGEPARAAALLRAADGLLIGAGAGIGSRLALGALATLRGLLV
jgi:hypothetical protein